jgi:hypothetical protein
MILFHVEVNNKDNITMFAVGNIYSRSQPPFFNTELAGKI